jgi:hypothetical protein
VGQDKVGGDDLDAGCVATLGLRAAQALFLLTVSHVSRNHLCARTRTLDHSHGRVSARVATSAAALFGGRRPRALQFVWH